MFFHHLKPSLSPQFYNTNLSLFSFYFASYLSFAKIGFIFWKNKDIQKEPSFEINNFCLEVIMYNKPKIKKNHFNFITCLLYINWNNFSLFKVVRAETQLAQDCSVILYTKFRQHNGCLCKTSIIVTAQFLRN